jgi:hypothetical protein
MKRKERPSSGKQADESSEPSAKRAKVSKPEVENKATLDDNKQQQSYDGGEDDDDDIIAVRERLARIGFPGLPCICRLGEIESVFVELQGEQGNRVRYLREQGMEDGQIRVVLLYFGWNEEADEIDKKVGTAYLQDVIKSVYIQTFNEGFAAATDVFEHCGDDDIKGNANWIVLEYLDREGYVTHTSNLCFTRVTNKAYRELLEAKALDADEDTDLGEQDEAARAAGLAFFDYGPLEQEDEVEEEADGDA